MSTEATTKPKESLAFQQLKEQLREMFQLDRGDLDFGIYRVMNQKREDVTKFLDEQLLPQVREVLEGYQPAGMAGAQVELNKMIASLKEAGVDPETSPKVQEIRQKLTQSVDVDKLENEIYSDLYNFFKRYYSDGDFMSMRRYKEGVYALPYEGEEVKLHWANHDQYYIKTSENLKNFTFKASGNKRVRFEVVAGGTETNNNKAQEGKERRFILHADAPTEVTGDELIIRFEYRPDTDKRKQDALNNDAVGALSPLAEVSSSGLLELAPTDKKKDRTVLEKYLTEYTAKFSFDYFIHKDLGTFLRRELDFYIKNEIFHLDDIENEDAPKVESYLGKIIAMRKVAGKIIQFLAQLEDFQKKLWLKKKFVLETHYCVTLDYIIGSDVANELLPIIAVNEAQNAEWVKLFAINELDSYAETLSVDFLEVNDKLLVDTKFFDVDFKYRLLSVFDDLDAQADGLLINSENFQALNMLQARYHEKVDYLYIDPPYNTDSAPILYKNNYQSSSWIALMASRLPLSKALLTERAVQTVAIDDKEMVHLSMLLEAASPNSKLTKVTVIHNPKGSITKDFNRVHEYALFVTPADVSNCIARTLEKNEKPRKMRRWGAKSLRVERRPSFYPIYVKGNKITRIGTVPSDDFHPASKNTPEKNDEVAIWPIDQDGVERRWNFGLDSINQNLSRIVALEKDGELDLFVTHEETVPKTVWSGGEFDAGSYGNTLLINMLGDKLFDFPKSINTVERAISISTDHSENPLILDYFGGSGTTGHAVININRKSDKKRKYALVEMGEYFHKVTKPRVQKASYSSNWKDGKPVSRDGVSQILKYMALEQYEDALDNLTITKTEKQGALLAKNQTLNEQYMLGYMMEIETKGSPSLLNIDSFSDPFAYQLRITRDDDTQLINVDLIETFNYLLGLTIRTVDRDKNGIVTVVGTNSLGENCLVIWRNVNDVDSIALEAWFGKRYSSKDFEFDAIYVNGDNNIENLKVDGDLWKVRLIEAEFSRLMFDVQDV